VGVNSDGLLLAAARLGPVALVAPALGRGVLPRLVVGAALIWVVAANLPATVATPAVVTRELLIGLFLAVTVAAPFWAAQLAGRLVDQARGIERGPLDVALTLWALALWCGVGGPRLLVRALGDTYAAMPIGSLTLSPSLVSAAAHVFAAGLAMAAPVLAVLLLVELGAALLLRHDGQGDSVRGLRSLVAIGALALMGAVTLAVLSRELTGLKTLAGQ